MQTKGKTKLIQKTPEVFHLWQYKQRLWLTLIFESSSSRNKTSTCAPIQQILRIWKRLKLHPDDQKANKARFEPLKIKNLLQMLNKAMLGNVKF